MKLANRSVLRAIFAMQGNFTAGLQAETKRHDGVEIAPYLNGAKAAVSFSADFELNWAWRGRLTPAECSSKGQTERRNIPFILQLCDEYDVPITWATVGHLFLKECQKGGEQAHPEMPRPILNDRWEGDWYQHDPRMSWLTDPLWYAPDLVERILKSRVRHEIGTHSFSHVKFSVEHSSRSLVKRELEECAVAMAPFKIVPRSLVYPHNIMGDAFLDVIAEKGIVAVRQRCGKTRLAFPERTSSGVYKIVESMNLRTPKHYDYLSKVQVFVTEAIRSGTAFHLWFHPSDPRELFEKELARILRYVSQMHAEHYVWIATMKDLVAYCETRRQTEFQVSRNAGEICITFSRGADLARYGASESTVIIDVPDRPKALLLRRGTCVSQHKGRFLPAGMAKSRSAKFLVNMPADCTELKVVL